MKLILALLLISSSAFAGQVSYQEGSMTTSNANYYGSGDRRLQVNFGDEDYIFMGYRRLSVCPHYCGFDYDMLGLGIGQKYKVGFANIFAQVGYYKIENSVGKTDHNENLFYYFNARFGFHHRQYFESYEVKNDDALGVSIGVDVPLNKHIGIKFSYQYMKIDENIIGIINSKEYWHDPVSRDVSTIGAGVYVDF